MRLVAYEVQEHTGMRVEPASQHRDWMEAADRFAYRCLPMVVANQHGWVVTNARTFGATWTGAPGLDGIILDGEPTQVSSHFGMGILTWNLPWLFRTTRGWNLLTRGVPNMPKDGALSLEGLVETDWAVATFTHNWKLTRPGLRVQFDADEPIAFLQPVRRGMLEKFTPTVQRIASAPQLLQRHYQAWYQSRARFNGDPARGNRWQKDYFQGRGPGGGGPLKGEPHQTRIHLEPFKDAR